jgi:hypothetical protein
VERSAAPDTSRGIDHPSRRSGGGNSMQRPAELLDLPPEVLVNIAGHLFLPERQVGRARERRAALAAWHRGAVHCTTARRCRRRRQHHRCRQRIRPAAAQCSCTTSLSFTKPKMRLCSRLMPRPLQIEPPFPLPAGWSWAGCANSCTMPPTARGRAFGSACPSALAAQAPWPALRPGGGAAPAHRTPSFCSMWTGSRVWEKRRPRGGMW